MLKIVERILIEDNAQKVADKETGCAYMFEHSRLQELKQMYDLYDRNANGRNVETKAIITNSMQPYIVARGNAIVKDEEILKDPI